MHLRGDLVPLGLLTSRHFAAVPLAEDVPRWSSRRASWPPIGPASLRCRLDRTAGRSSRPLSIVVVRLHCGCKLVDGLQDCREQLRWRLWDARHNRIVAHRGHAAASDVGAANSLRTRLGLILHFALGSRLPAVACWRLRVTAGRRAGRGGRRVQKSRTCVPRSGHAGEAPVKCCFSGGHEGYPNTAGRVSLSRLSSCGWRAVYIPPGCAGLRRRRNISLVPKCGLLQARNGRAGASENESSAESRGRRASVGGAHVSRNRVGLRPVRGGRRRSVRGASMASGRTMWTCLPPPISGVLSSLR